MSLEVLILVATLVLGVMVYVAIVSYKLGQNEQRIAELESKHSEVKDIHATKSDLNNLKTEMERMNTQVEKIFDLFRIDTERRIAQQT